ncbi:class I SAM-dependent methyltransferase [Flindersiella endophytica]
MSFGQAAVRYDRIRPTYPPDALRWALETVPDGSTVVDLGAGTGLLTRVLLGLGYDVVPVEPDAGMRAQLDAATPGTVSREGSAEALPVADGSLDAVVCGQAYHWFDREKAHPELARAIRPGGVFAPIWNLRDESAAWVRELSVITRQRADGTLYRIARTTEPGGSGRADGVVYDFGPEFGAVERAEFRHATTHTADSLVELVRSRSYYLTASADEQAAIEQGVRALANEHPDLAGKETFDLPYVTVTYRAHRR